MTLFQRVGYQFTGPRLILRLAETVAFTLALLATRPFTFWAWCALVALLVVGNVCGYIEGKGREDW